MFTRKFLLTIISILPTLASAQLTTTELAPTIAERVSLKGSFRLRSEASDQTDFVSRRNFNLIRLRAGLDIKANEEVNIFFQPQFSKVDGEPAYVGNSTTTNSFQQTSGTTYDSAMSVHQAFMKYKPNEDYEVIAGRQVFSFGDELVIGGLDWHNVSRSFDAMRVNIFGDKMNNTIFASKIVDMNTTTQSTAAAQSHGDRNLYGFYNTFDLGEKMKALDLYALYQTDHTQQPITYQTLSSDLYVFGTRTASKINNFDYRAELTAQDGSNNINIKNAYQGDIEFGYTIDSKAKPRLAVEAFSSGRNYDQLYPTVHKWLGIADVIGRKNVSGFAAHYSQQWSEVFSTVLDYHYFARTNNGYSAYKLNGVTPLGNAAVATGKKLGDEIDLVCKYKMNSALVLSGGGGYFVAAKYLRDQFDGTNPIFTYVQLEANF